MSNTIDLKEVDAKPDPKLIKHIENILDQAKSGKIIAIACALQYTDDDWSTGWYAGNKRTTTIHLMGTLNRLIYELCHQWEVPGEEIQQ